MRPSRSRPRRVRAAIVRGRRRERAARAPSAPPPPSPRVPAALPSVSGSGGAVEREAHCRRQLAQRESERAAMPRTAIAYQKRAALLDCPRHTEAGVRFAEAKYESVQEAGGRPSGTVARLRDAHESAAFGEPRWSCALRRTPTTRRRAVRGRVRAGSARYSASDESIRLAARSAFAFA